ncbi:acyltransferase 3 [Globomyces pollinis-pini]|nr:acyltransferase 3 [Globomyces pollinis-pini]
MSNKLLYLEGLRGIAAFMVYQIHTLLDYNLSFRPAWMWYQQWTICVPIFFVLSGRVLTVSPMRKGDQTSIIASMIKRPFRLTLPVIGVMIVGKIIYELGLFDLKSPCRISEYAFCASSDKVAHTFFDMFVRPFLYINNSPGLFPNYNSAIPLPYTSWTLPLEYTNSNYLYVLTIVLIHFKESLQIQYFIIIVALLLSLFGHLWTAHFIVGLIFADLSNRGVFKKLMTYKLTYLCSTLAILLSLFLSIDSPYSIGAIANASVKNLQVNSQMIFGAWETYYGSDERPMVLLLCTAVMFAIETSSWLQWILGSKPFVFLGRISYMLYLAHPIFNYSIHQLLYKAIDSTTPVGSACLFVVTTSCACLFSEILVRIIDEPVLKLLNYAYDKIFKMSPKKFNVVPSTSVVQQTREIDNQPMVIDIPAVQIEKDR